MSTIFATFFKSLKLFKNENLKKKKTYIVVCVMMAECIYSKLAQMHVRIIWSRVVRERFLKESNISLVLGKN